jgi:hypothetical protein
MCRVGQSTCARDGWACRYRKRELFVGRFIQDEIPRARSTVGGCHDGESCSHVCGAASLSMAYVSECADGPCERLGNCVEPRGAGTKQDVCLPASIAAVGQVTLCHHPAARALIMG